MAASNQRYFQLLDEYLLLKVSVSEALLGVYKKHPEILLDRTVYDYFHYITPSPRIALLRVL